MGFKKTGHAPRLDIENGSPRVQVRQNASDSTAFDVEFELESVLPATDATTTPRKVTKPSGLGLRASGF